MFFPIFFAVLIFVFLFTFLMKRGMKGYGKNFESYVAAEVVANSVRAKPITDELLFVPDISIFPVKDAGAEDILSKQRVFLERAGEKMIRFDAPMTNTELKMIYGLANLEKITEYEENFYRFNYALNDWAEALLTAGDEAAGAKVLLGGVLCKVQTAKTYKTLADIYDKNNSRSEMAELKRLAGDTYMPAQDDVSRYLSKFT